MTDDLRPYFEPGGYRGRLRCTLCKISPERPSAHVATVQHRLQVRVWEMRDQGWAPAGGATAMIRSSGVPWRLCPSFTRALSRVYPAYKGTDEDFDTVTWAPAWAVEIASVFGASVVARAAWLRHTQEHGTSWFEGDRDVIEAAQRMGGRAAVAQVWAGLYKEAVAARGLGQDGQHGTEREKGSPGRT